MEKMAGDVNDCLKWVKFGGKFIEVYRGLKEDNWILNDEADVKKFLSLSEFGKEASGMSYRARRHPWCSHCMMSGELTSTTRENTGATTQ